MNQVPTTRNQVLQGTRYYRVLQSIEFRICQAKHLLHRVTKMGENFDKREFRFWYPSFAQTLEHVYPTRGIQSVQELRQLLIKLPVTRLWPISNSGPTTRKYPPCVQPKARLRCTQNDWGDFWGTIRYKCKYSDIFWRNNEKSHIAGTTKNHQFGK